MWIKTVKTRNYGLGKKWLFATRHVAALTPELDGYVNMDNYNRQSSWNK